MLHFCNILDTLVATLCLPDVPVSLAMHEPRIAKSKLCAMQCREAVRPACCDVLIDQLT